MRKKTHNDHETHQYGKQCDDKKMTSVGGRTNVYGPGR